MEFQQVQFLQEENSDKKYEEEEYIKRKEEALSQQKYLLKYQEDVGFAFRMMNMMDITIFQKNQEYPFSMESIPKKDQGSVTRIQKELEKEGYQVIKYSGSGNQGTVLIAQKNSQRYAIKSIKIIDQYGQIDEDLANEVKKEVELLKKSKSDYIVNFIDYFRGQLHYHIVMEECICTLEDILKNENNKLNENTFLKYGLEILLGIQDAHNLGIILRDIKPENILINYQNKAKLSDFGQAGQLSINQSVIQSSNIKGNFLFASPECVQNTLPDIKAQIQEVFEQKKKLNQTKQKEVPATKQGIRSDLYSVGLLFISMLGGTSIQISQKRSKILNEDFIPNIYGFKNKMVIQNIVTGLNQYLPQDRISVQEAIQLFETMEFVISTQKIRQSILPPSLQFNNEVKYFDDTPIMQNETNYYPKTLFQDSSSQQCYQQNLQTFKYKEKYESIRDQLNILQGMISDSRYFCFPQEFNPFDFPIQKMDFCYHGNDELYYITFIFPNQPDHNCNLNSSQKYRELYFFSDNQYAINDTDTRQLKGDFQNKYRKLNLDQKILQKKQTTPLQIQKNLPTILMLFLLYNHLNSQEFYRIWEENPSFASIWRRI